MNDERIQNEWKIGYEILRYIDEHEVDDFTPTDLIKCVAKKTGIDEMKVTHYLVIEGITSIFHTIVKELEKAIKEGKKEDDKDGEKEREE